MAETVFNNMRIAKNTLMLYLRTFVVLLVSLYTSRVILEILGVKDFGIYQVVGGLVSMFSIVSGVFTIAISRFITFELGKGNREKLHRIFSTSLIIQFIISVIIIVLVEGFGLWFINHKMTIPSNQINAVIWVLQFSVVTFCLNLISLPYNACIIAHEKMKAFAYISVLEVSLKLGACYILFISPIDRLIAYSALLMIIALGIRSIYSVYCYKNFEECRGNIEYDSGLMKEMFSFSGWNFIINTSAILNNQGITMLINVFFGLTINAARGLASQVESAVMQFVTNFTMAINPQITKSYATGDMEGLYKLLCRSAKFAPMAMMIIAIPLIFEMEPVLKIWLGKVPEYTVIFAQLSLIVGWIDCIGNSAYTACMASGHIRKYSLIVTPVGYLDFFIVWILFSFGWNVVWAYWIFIIIKVLINIIRVFLLKELIGLKIYRFLKDVYLPILCVGVLSLIFPYLVNQSMPESIFRIVATSITSITAVCVFVYFIGMDTAERKFVINRISNYVHRNT